jgi:hypothetical protein
VATAVPVERTIDLAATPAVGRARFVALAIAELVSLPPAPALPPPAPPSTPAPPEPSPNPPSPAPPTQAPAPPRVAPTEAPDAAWALEGFAHERSALATAFAAWGGGARVRHNLAPHLEWAVDARGDHGALGASLGSVAVTSASLGASFGLRHLVERLTLRGALGLRAGIRALAGKPNDASLARGGSFVAASAGPAIDAGAEIALDASILMGIAGEAGLDLVPARGLVNGLREISIGGAWAGARLSLGVRF